MRRQRLDQRRDVEGPVQAHLEQAHLLAARHHPLDGLVRGLGAGAHHHHHPLRLRVAHVVEQSVAPPGEAREAVHHGRDLARAHVVERVHRLARLEVGVGVVGRAPQGRVVGRERAGAVRRDGSGVLSSARSASSGTISILLDLVRRAEAVEEVEERHARLERRRVRDGREIVRLLHGARAEQGEARLPAGHRVGVVAEDRERVRRDGARRDVHHEGRELAGDLVHVGDHRAAAPATP